MASVSISFHNAVDKKLNDLIFKATDALATLVDADPSARFYSICVRDQYDQITQYLIDDLLVEGEFSRGRITGR